MVSTDTFRDIALSLNGVIEQPHFDRTAFKVTGKKIFASLLESEHSANILVPVEEQGVFAQYAPDAIYPVPNKFGLKGWTTFELDRLDVSMVSEALYVAYQQVMNPASGKISSKDER
ncbi:MAG: MmcQ/YjbR family DNA-binding protein [Bacteroidetes bacterium]|nr:MmcQ/YjbR family DNA-binding protein [Bacteroidota bacterium]